MALTATEEALIRQLLDQQAAILSLASSESTIISKLGATKVTLADLTSASSAEDSDLMLIRQGTTEKSITPLVLIPDASETVKGKVELATVAEAQAGTDTTRAVTPAGLSGVSQAVVGGFSNLKASATGTNANIQVTADEIVVENYSNSYKTLRAVSLTVAGTSVGANGIDAGTIAASTWYSLWVIWNGTTISGLLSLSATAPTLPSGYTHKARVGWIRTDGNANKYPLSFTQQGRRVQYKVAAGSNVTAMPVAASGVLGTWHTTTPTYVSVSLVNFVPSTAGKAVLSVAGKYNNGTTTNVILAPNASYSGVSTANPPPISTSLAGGSDICIDSALCELILESTNVYVVSQTSGGAILVSGWEDNL